MKKVIPILLVTFAIIFAEGTWTGNNALVNEGVNQSIGNVTIPTGIGSTRMQLFSAAPFHKNAVKRHAGGNPSPLLLAEDTIKYDGDNYTGIGVGSAYTWITAVRFTPDMACTVKAVTFYRYGAYSLGPSYVYLSGSGTPSSPGAILDSAPYTAVNDTWMRVDFTSGHFFTGGQDFWIGVKLIQLTGGYPIGADAGPSVIPYRSWISDSSTMTPGGWYTLASVGLDYNWNIRALCAFVLADTDMATTTITNVPLSTPPYQHIQVKAVLRNVGNDPMAAGIPVKMQITGPSGYAYPDIDQTTPNPIARLAYDTITFVPNWTMPSYEGQYTVKCWVEAPGDPIHGNDTARFSLDASNWLTYALWSNYRGVSGAGPERAMKFIPFEYNVVHPITIDSLMAQFGDTLTPWSWGSAKFTFKIYGNNGFTLLYESDSIEVDTLNPVGRCVVNPPVTITSGSYYVAVAPRSNGTPKSVRDDNTVNPRCYTGSAGSWTAYSRGEFYIASYVCWQPSPNDVGPTAIVTPISIIAPGTTITPKAQIQNFGLNNATAFPVTMTMDSAGTIVYTGTATVSIDAGENSVVDFTPQWTSGPAPNAYNIKVYTGLTIDDNMANDTITGYTSSFTIITLMRAKFTAVLPTIDGNVDAFEWSDANKYDASDVLGAGNGTPYRAGSSYLWMKHDTNFVYVAVTMPYATAANDRDQIGLYLDENRDGSWAVDSSEGNYWLVNYETDGVDSLIYRAWTPDLTTWRYGQVPGSQLVCNLNNGYMNIEAAIPKGSEKHQIYFRPFLNADTMRLWMFAVDQPNNDYFGWWPQSMSGSGWQYPYQYGNLIFSPPYYDVGVSGIIEPSGSVARGTSVIPKAIVKNYGLATTTFPVIFTITEQKAGEYIDTVMVQLSGMQTDTVEFDPWLANNVTSYQTEVRTVMPGDMAGGNDYYSSSFEVIPATWAQLTNVPQAGDVPGKSVKDGGSMTATGTDLYVFPGNKSWQFFKYDPDGKGWITTLESIPYGFKYPVTDPPKENKKKIGKGASLCYDGDNTIYATKGNGTKEFWAYDISLNTWTAKAYVDVPKGLKGGTSMVAKDGEIYLLAGSQKKDAATNFFVYNPTADTALGLPWTGLTTAPLTPPTTGKLKVWKDGSAISIIGDTIYALKGGDKFNFFYAYDIAEGTWIEMESIPLIHPQLGKKNKVGDGGAMTTSGSALYVIKGKGKQDFWAYTPGSPGQWTEMDTVKLGALGKKGAPKTGAALAFLNNKIYLMKGNKTAEFWSYSPVGGKEFNTRIEAQTRTSVMAEPAPLLKFSFDVNPNPFTKLTIIRYTVPVSGKVSIKLYNAIGRLIETLNNGYLTQGIYTTSLSTTNLSKGIYFIRYEDIANRKEIKLINQ